MEGTKFFPACGRKGRLFSGSDGDVYWPNTSFLHLSEMASVEQGLGCWSGMMLSTVVLARLYQN